MLMWRRVLASTQFLTTPLGNENQTIMADLSNPSNPTSYEELLEEYQREYDRAVEGLLLSCFRITEQGVVKIKELQPPSTIDVLMEMQSSGTLSNVLSDFVKYLIDKEDSSVATSVIQKSAIEKPTNNPCNDLPTCDVVGQDTIRLSQAEFIELKSPSKSTTKSSTTTLGGQQNKDKGSPTGLTASSRVSGGKFQPKMVKPKKPDIGVWKTVEAIGRRKHQKEKPKPVLGELPAKSKKQNNDASRSKNSKQAKSVLKQKYYDRSRQWNNFSTSMSFPSYRSHMDIPWGAY